MYQGESRLTHLIACYNIMTGWLDKGRAVNVVYPDFREAFHTISHNILVGKKYGVKEWTVRWFENWLMAKLKGL